jgi:succinate dehydrogenase/fumarate reductase cytochrome b subunit
MALRDLHRTSAAVIGVFAVVHIANHLVSLSGVPAHIAFMAAARSVYRELAVESLLLFCVAFQIASGLWLVLRGWRQRAGAVAWLQAISGTYLAFFFLVHIAAILFGRSVLGLDTNFYYAAAGFHVPPYQLFFAPYYFLGVLALFTHLGCAAYRRVDSRPRVVRTLALALPMSVGAVVSLLIGLSLAGHIVPVDIPAKYRATYARTAG